MTMAFLRRLLPLCALVCALVFPAIVSADDAADAARAEAKLETTKLTDFVHKDSTLDKVFQDLQRTAGVNILVDTKNVDAKEMKVTIELVGVSAKAALDLVLLQKGLTRQYRNGVIWISTKEAAQEKPVLVAKIYDVRDITAPVRDFPAPDATLKGDKPRVQDPPAPAARQETTIDDVIESIQTAVQPDGGWYHNGHAISPLNGQLVVTTTAELHKKVADLLDQLRATK